MTQLPQTLFFQIEKDKVFLVPGFQSVIRSMSLLLPMKSGTNLGGYILSTAVLVLAWITVPVLAP